jgi:hypothetical protein
MKLKEGQLLSLIAVCMIALCMWAAGGCRSKPSASDRATVSGKSGAALPAAAPSEQARIQLAVEQKEPQEPAEAAESGKSEASEPAAAQPHSAATQRIHVVQKAVEATIAGKVKAAPAASKLAYAATVEPERKAGDKTAKVTYKVTNDVQGKKLAKDADGKKAEIKGTVEVKDKDHWLTVKEFKVVEEKHAK